MRGIGRALQQMETMGIPHWAVGLVILGLVLGMVYPETKLPLLGEAFRIGVGGAGRLAARLGTEHPALSPKAAGMLKLGDARERDTVVGPVITEVHRDRVESFIQSGVDAGARLVCGGERPDLEGFFAVLGRRFFLMLVAVKAWTLVVAFTLIGGLTSSDTFNIAFGVLPLVLMLNSAHRIQVAGVAVAWVLALLSMVLRGAGLIS